MAQFSQLRWLLPIGVAAVPAVHSAYAVQYASVEQAQHDAFAHATAFAQVPLTPADLQRAPASGDALPQGWSPLVWEARQGDERLGWFFVDKVIGKTEAITYAVSLGADGAVSSLEILEYREAHGSEVRLPAWRRQFVGKRAQDAVRLDSDIRNLSGATLSCRHLTDGVHRLLQLYDHVLRAAAK